MIALGADHGGFILKEAVKDYLIKNNIDVKDFGTFSEESVDYPLYAKLVCESIVRKESQFGLLFCGTGIGISIAANKFNGIRAAVCTDKFCAQMSRCHNDANVLCLGGRVIDEKTAIELTMTFINTDFEGGRHKRRIDKIKDFEKQCELTERRLKNEK